MKIYLSFILLLIAYNSILAQDFIINGKTVDNYNLPIDNMEVLLLTEKDSIIVKKDSTTSEGLFSLQVPKNNYILQLNYLGILPTLPIS